MTSDPHDDALSWAGDDEPQRAAAPEPQTPVLPRGWSAVGKGSASVASTPAEPSPSAPIAPADPDAIEDAAAHDAGGLSSAMLLTVGVVGGIYLLYTIGWIVSGLNVATRALFVVPSVAYYPTMWVAALAPALWFLGVWVATRKTRSWVRVVALLAGVLLLVPWPFVMVGGGA